MQGAGRTTRKGTKGASRNVQGRKEVFANVAAGIDSKVNARVAAHISSLICVSLRMAASAEAPSAPMSLSSILQAMGRMGTVRE